MSMQLFKNATSCGAFFEVYGQRFCFGGVLVNAEAALSDVKRLHSDDANKKVVVAAGAAGYS